MARCFTVPQANALIPALEKTFAELDTLRASIEANHEKLQLLELLWGEKLSELANPDALEALAHRQAIEESMAGIQRLLHDEIVSMGLRFPMGGLEHGLVDFPSTWQGRWVLLCWRRGEPQLLAWHELDGGFAGRQEITPVQERAMGTQAVADPLDDEGRPLL